MDGSSATPPATAVLEVTQETASALFRTLACALPRAAAVAVDCELTGLGAAVGRKAASQSPQQRYTTLRHVAATRALLSIGICCLERLPPPPPSSSSAGGGAESKPNTDVAASTPRFAATTFEVSVACQTPYVVEPNALRFLTRHGFDFNRQVHHGLPYTPAGGSALADASTAAALPAVASARAGPAPSVTAATTTSNVAATQPVYPRLLFKLLVSAACPLVVHNGWIDLLFLYHHLYAPLPPTLDEFLACLADLCPHVVDTKYLAEYTLREPATFLEYLFRRAQRRVATLTAKSGAFVFAPAPGLASLRRQCPTAVLDVPLSNLRSRASLDTPICEQYARHGHCDGQELDCKLVHDLEAILDREELAAQRRAAKRAKRSGRSTDSTPANGDDSDNEERDMIATATEAAENTPVPTLSAEGGKPLPQQPRNHGHRAGFDAFMTGYVYLAYSEARPDDVKAGKGKLYLTGRNMPLLVEKSRYVTMPASHVSARAQLR